MRKEKVSGAVCDYPFFEDLVYHRDQEVREIIESILTQVTSTFFDHLEYHKIGDLAEETSQ